MKKPYQPPISIDKQIENLVSLGFVNNWQTF